MMTTDYREAARRELEAIENRDRDCKCSQCAPVMDAICRYEEEYQRFRSERSKRSAERLREIIGIHLSESEFRQVDLLLKAITMPTINALVS